jgi:hypothetical protein
MEDEEREDKSRAVESYLSSNGRAVEDVGDLGIENVTGHERVSERMHSAGRAAYVFKGICLIYRPIGAEFL